MTIPPHSDPNEYPAAARAARLARRTRYEAAVARTRRARRIVLSIIGALTVLTTVWWVWSPVGPASSDSAFSRVSTAEGEHELRATQQPPTPIFGHYDDLQLHLVVAESDLTEIGFHRAARDHALPMTSLLPDADMQAADGGNGTGRTYVEVEVEADDLAPRTLGGTALRMWRSSRPGPPDTAVDIGAPAGSTVYAPVTGTIIAITSYELYGKHEDIEIHIQPAGWPDIDLVLIHVSDVSVNVGERVTAGVTPLATVRLLSDRIDHQLGQYSTDPGDHVHMQLNRIGVPGNTEPPDES